MMFNGLPGIFIAVTGVFIAMNARPRSTALVSSASSSTGVKVAT